MAIVFISSAAHFSPPAAAAAARGRSFCRLFRKVAGGEGNAGERGVRGGPHFGPARKTLGRPHALCAPREDVCGLDADDLLRKLLQDVLQAEKGRGGARGVSGRGSGRGLAGVLAALQQAAGRPPEKKRRERPAAAAANSGQRRAACWRRCSKQQGGPREKTAGATRRRSSKQWATVREEPSKEGGETAGKSARRHGRAAVSKLTANPSGTLSCSAV